MKTVLSTRRKFTFKLSKTNTYENSIEIGLDQWLVNHTPSTPHINQSYSKTVDRRVKNQSAQTFAAAA